MVCLADVARLCGFPYFSPIYVQYINPMKTGKNKLELTFINGLYAAGVKGFNLELKVLRRYETYMVTDLGYDRRTGIISELNLDWLIRFTPNLIKDAHPERFRSRLPIFCRNSSVNTLPEIRSITLMRSAMKHTRPSQGFNRETLRD